MRSLMTRSKNPSACTRSIGIRSPGSPLDKSTNQARRASGKNAQDPAFPAVEFNFVEAQDREGIPVVGVRDVVDVGLRRRRFDRRSRLLGYLAHRFSISPSACQTSGLDAPCTTLNSPLIIARRLTLGIRRPGAGALAGACVLPSAASNRFSGG